LHDGPAKRLNQRATRNPKLRCGCLNRRVRLVCEIERAPLRRRDGWRASFWPPSPWSICCLFYRVFA